MHQTVRVIALVPVPALVLVAALRLPVGRVQPLCISDLQCADGNLCKGWSAASPAPASPDRR